MQQQQQLPLEAPQTGSRIQQQEDDFVSQLKKSSHFPIILVDMIFKAVSVVFYLLCKVLPVLSNSFITQFVVITIVLAADFWFVKNVTGRKLVGMRWWSEPSSDGAKSTWQFESMICVANPSRAISNVDATWFWSGLIAMTIFWIVMAIIYITKPGYCILAILGFGFCMGNLWGFYQCRRWGKAELAAMQTGGMASTISDMTSSIASGFLSVINKV